MADLSGATVSPEKEYQTTPALTGVHRPLWASISDVDEEGEWLILGASSQPLLYPCTKCIIVSLTVFL